MNNKSDMLHLSQAHRYRKQKYKVALKYEYSKEEPTLRKHHLL